MSNSDDGDQLSMMLRNLRNLAGLTQPDAARASGTSQASISRWEKGRMVPALGDVRALLRAYEAGPEAVQTVEQLVSDLRGDTAPSARVTMRRAGNMQQRVGRIEHGSAVIRTFQPVLFPGLLQTQEYARAVFSSGGEMAADQVEAGLIARMDRADVLDDGSRSFTAVLSEGVLRWPLASREVMAEQIDHVLKVSTRGNVHIGVIPSWRPVQVAPTHGFDVFDERAALVGTETATAFLTDHHDVSAYLKLFADLERAAVFDEEGRAELRAAAAWYREKGRRK